MNETIARLIIENCHNDYLFEKFAIEICTKEYGIQFLPTSLSWDRGRDGRSTGLTSGSHKHILCATLNRDIDSKVEADLLRVTSTSSPDNLVYCSGQYLSEEKIDEITRTIKRHAPTGGLIVYGSLQLAKLASKFPTIFENHFHAELESIRETLKPSEPNDDEQTRSLRLALLTAGNLEGADLRNDILKRAVLDSLSNGLILTLDQIAGSFSQDVGLPYRVQADFLAGTLKALRNDGLVNSTPQGWQLTTAGSDLVSATPIGAAESLLKGQAVIRQSVDRLIGKKLSDSQHQRIWSTLLDFLSALFYHRGLDVIHAFDEFLAHPDKPSSQTTLQSMLRDGTHRVAVAAASFPDDQVLIETAILDLLTEREGPAFEWLMSTCERFVILCCLGIEARSAIEIRKVLIEGGIIPDTDILLTFLCPHASDHAAIRELLLRWIAVGGTILLAPVILEEVAYHAWISEVDFRETQHLLDKLHGIDRYRYLRNAFVREFHALNAPEPQWDLFISQYRGNSNGDYTKVRDLLRSKLHAGMVPDAYDETLAKQITRYLMEQAAIQGSIGQDEVDEDTEHKLSRDGRLLASIAAFRKHEAALATKAAVTILSSSSGLRRGSLKFSDTFQNDSHVVLSRGAFAYLLSLIPETQLGADSLRRALFDFGRAGALQDTDRRAQRIIKSAGIHDVPWAGRWLLSSQLRKSMQNEASRLGVHPGKIKEAVKTGNQPETAARVIIDALTQLSEDPEETERLRAAEHRIADLEAQLNEAQKLLRKAKT